MTAIIAIVQRDAAYVLTDGAVFLTTGIVHSFATKAFPIPHLKTVLAWRGTLGWAHFAAMHLGSLARSFDELKSVAVDGLRTAILETDNRVLRSLGTRDFDCVAVGISENAGPQAFAFCNHDRSPDLPPWQIRDILDCSMAPMSSEIRKDLFRHIPPGTPGDDIDPERDGVVMMQCQRRHALLYGDDLSVHVGGFVLLTCVTDESIVTRIIHRWPDQVGQQIGTVRDAEVSCG